MTRRAARILACTLLVASACAGARDEGPVELLMAVPDASDTGPSPGTWREPDRSEAVTVEWDERRDLRWRTGRVQASDGEERARVVLGPAAALLLYHAASRHAGFADALAFNRLASISPRDDAPTGVALLFDPDPSDPTRGQVSLLELSAGDAADSLAAALALGAWEPLTWGRLHERGRIPLFVPSEPEWANLRGSSLEGFLPGGLARQVVETAGLRAAVYARLAQHADTIGRLADSVDELAASSPAAVPHGDLAELRELLARASRAWSTYLDSVWIELLVASVSPDAARIALHAHTVIPLELRAFELALGRTQALAQSDAIGRLRLRDEDSGEAAAAQLGKQGIVFALGRTIEPVVRGPYRFGSTRLRYRLEGLDGSPELREALLERLEPRLVKSATGEPVAQDHWRRVFSVVDRRFGAAGDESLKEFRKTLPSRLTREGAADGEDLLRVDRERRLLTLPAGAYRASGDLIAPAGWNLRLEAGVEIGMAPGRSILVRGALFVNGSPERPVRISPLEEGEPWGVLAVQGLGRGTARASEHRPRSVVRYLELSGGSDDELRGVHYGGQLSVYHQDLVLANTTLRAAAGEASLDATRSHVDIRDTAVLESAGDGVQLDRVEGTLRRTRVERSGAGSDGLDISKGSDVAVEDSIIGEAGDECIEVGERSRLRLTGSLVRRCEVGLASKDLAEVDIRETAFFANGSSLAAYQNAAVFGPGRIVVADVLMLDARGASRRDEGSEIEQADAGAGPVGSDRAREALAAASAFSVEAFRSLRSAAP